MEFSNNKVWILCRQIYPQTCYMEQFYSKIIVIKWNTEKATRLKYSDCIEDIHNRLVI